MTFQQKLNAIVAKNNSLLCVGLDPQWEKLPASVKTEQFPQFSFNKAIIDATHDLVCAFKPNSAFYEAFGSDGIRALKMTCDYLHNNYPHIPTILDFKRGDIGFTSEAYAEYAFDYLRVDAVTLQPYLGKESIQNFLKRKDKGCIILCRTSNPGAGEFQDLQINREPLFYIYVAKKVINDWNKQQNCMLVVGATYPQELEEVRKLAGDMTFLVPGVGTQGGQVESMVKVGLNSKKSGMIINSSRGIIFASHGNDYAKRAREEAQKLRDEINLYRFE